MCRQTRSEQGQPRKLVPGRQCLVGHGDAGLPGAGAAAGAGDALGARRLSWRVMAGCLMARGGLGLTPAARAGTGASTEQAARQPQPSLSSPGGSPACTAVAFSNTVSSKQGIVREFFSICSHRERLRQLPSPGVVPAAGKLSSPHWDGLGAAGVRRESLAVQSCSPGTDKRDENSMPGYLPGDQLSRGGS